MFLHTTANPPGTGEENLTDFTDTFIRVYLLARRTRDNTLQLCFDSIYPDETLQTSPTPTSTTQPPRGPRGNQSRGHILRTCGLPNATEDEEPSTTTLHPAGRKNVLQTSIHCSAFVLVPLACPATSRNVADNSSLSFASPDPKKHGAAVNRRRRCQY